MGWKEPGRWRGGVKGRLRDDPHWVPGMSLVLRRVVRHSFSSKLTDCPGRLAGHQDKGRAHPPCRLSGGSWVCFGVSSPSCLSQDPANPWVAQALGNGWGRQKRPSLVTVSDLSFRCGSIELTRVVYRADVTSFGQSLFFKVVRNVFPGPQENPAIIAQQGEHHRGARPAGPRRGAGRGGVSPQCPGL